VNKRLRRLLGLSLPLAAGLLLIGAANSVMGPATLPPPEPNALAEPGMRLMSQSQYVNTITQVFGTDIPVKVRFAPVKREDGLLAVGAAKAVLTSGALDPLDAVARAVAAEVVDAAHRDFLLPCRPADTNAPDDACARAFFTRTGRLLLRRPPTPSELTAYVAVAHRAAERKHDFYDGIAASLAGLLVSPQFLYIRETAKPDPSTGAWQLDGYSKASRLSYLLWNSAPDEELLDAAGRGELHDPAGLRHQVERMIASPLYREGVREFFSDFLVLEAFDTLAKDPTIYPAFSLKAVSEAREQVLRTVVNHIVTRDGDYRDLFTTRDTMMSSELAIVYRVPVDMGSLGWVPYRFPDGGPRAGLLSEVGFLAQYAHPGRSSPTRRGRAIREVLLCQKVPDPPPNVDFSKFEDAKGGARTARERLTAHQENPVCAGCHRVTDPIGLGLENFDGAGQFRATENAAKIDASGTLDGIPFSDPAGLGRALHDNPALKSCIVDRLFSYSVGRHLVSYEEQKVEAYQAALDKTGYRFDAMLRMIVLDPAFFSVRPMQVAFTDVPKGGSRAAQD
jgi:hypothetical protein